MQTLGGSNKESCVVLDLLGPTVEFLVPAIWERRRLLRIEGDYPGVSVPLHKLL
jgi:hypothetical protein